MTRSEERLRVRTEEHPRARAVLRKHVVTEDVQVTVPVSHEEFRVEYEPITGDETPPAPTEGHPAESHPTESHPAQAPAATGGDPEALTLHTERIVVRTETVPTERVRLATDRVTEDQTVTGQVRREKIELDPPSDGHPQR
jgi:stress response protein YsnF